MARRKQREKRRSPQAKHDGQDMRGAKRAAKQAAVKAAMKATAPPPLPNAKAEPIAVTVQLRDVTVTEVGSVCPTCGATMNEAMPQRAAVALRAGQRIGVQCGRCGQPMLLEYREGQERRIVTVGEDLMMRARGR